MLAITIASSKSKFFHARECGQWFETIAQAEAIRDARFTLKKDGKLREFLLMVDTRWLLHSAQSNQTQCPGSPGLSKELMKKTKLHPLIDNLIQIAESRGINRNQVAVRSGVSPSVVGRIFSGERTCTVETFAKLVGGIGCEVKIK